MSSDFDVVVVGAGPAGTAVAYELAEVGARVALVDPKVHTPWAPFYCCFEHDVPPRYDRCLQRRWSSVRTHALRDRHVLTTYVRFDNDKLKATLRHPAVDLIEEHVRIKPAGVVLDNGRRLTSAVVVDARGRPISPGDAAQVAYGQMLEGPHGLDPDEAIWMDFSRVDGDAPLTFAYVLPHGADRVFVEETSLAARPPLSADFLASRLSARKASLGLSGQCVAEERCGIALGGELPHPQGSCLPFGAAAHFTHPATGFQLTRSLVTAPRVAQALMTQGSPKTRVRRAWQAAWPTRMRRTYGLFDLGLNTVLGFDAGEARAFFDALFSLKPAQWQRYLQTDASSRDVLAVMTRVFAEVRPQLRLRLLKLAAQNLIPRL